MPRTIRIKTGKIDIEAELIENKTAQAIWNALPIQAQGDTWGDEIYFTTPVHLELENGKELVNSGDLGYWPSGNAFCIFFGPTPISRKNEIRPASAVNVFGKIIGEARILKSVKSGAKIIVTRQDSPIR